MKKLFILAAIVMIVGVIVAPSAVAKKNKGQPPEQTVPSDVYAKYDVNTNGTLEVTEKAAIRKDFAKNPNDPLLKPYDLNSDGKLSDDEIAAIPAVKLLDAPKKKKKKNQNQ